MVFAAAAAADSGWAGLGILSLNQQGFGPLHPPAGALVT